MLIDTEAIKAALSNFYKDYSENQDSIDFFMALFDDITEYIGEYAESVKRNQIITSMDTYRRFHFAAFKGQAACYDVEELMSQEEYATIAGVESLSLENRVNYWNGLLTPQTKIDILTRAGYYIQLSAKRDMDVIEPLVVDLVLCNINSKALTRNVDYFLYNNKIFLNGSIAVPSVLNSSLIAKNIFVDYNFPYDLIGKRIGIRYEGSITKPEYRDFMQMVAYVLVKGPSIKNLKDAFNILAGWEGSSVYDMKNSTGARLDMWMNPTEAILSPFDFLVTVPASAASTVKIDTDTGELIPNDERLGILKSFLDVVKPTDTNYILALSEVIPEDEDSLDTQANNISFPVSDDNLYGDGQASNITLAIVERFDHGNLIRNINYDEGDLYDDSNAYDADTITPASTEAMFGDTVLINYIKYPEYPISFTATKNVLTGECTITFTDNAEDVEEYDILKNEEIITTVQATGDRHTISYIDRDLPAQPSGNYVYYAVSVYYDNEGKKVSRPSKKITIAK